jgi:hypothetical protein
MRTIYSSVAVLNPPAEETAVTDQLITIVPPPEVDPAGSGVFWATMAEVLRAGWRERLRRVHPHVAVEFRWAGRQLTIAVWVPGTVSTAAVQAAVRGAWPGSATTVTDATPPLPLQAPVAGGALTPALPAWYPLNTDHHNDPLRTLIAAAATLRASESACVQILARPARSRQTARLRTGIHALRTGRSPRSPLDPATWLQVGLDLVTELVGPTRRAGHPYPRNMGTDPQRDRDARAALDKLAGPLWQVAIRYAVAAGAPSTVAQAVPAAFGAWTGRNRLRHRRLRHPARVLADRRLVCAGRPVQDRRSQGKRESTRSIYRLTISALQTSRSRSDTCHTPTGEDSG